jgi:hypothetical protein
MSLDHYAKERMKIDPQFKRTMELGKADREYRRKEKEEMEHIHKKIERLEREVKRLNECPWCSQEMERVPVDGGNELGCTNENCPSFGIGVWCYADQLRTENRNLKHVNQGLYNMIEGLQNTNRRLLTVNAEYKGQAIGYSNLVDQVQRERDELLVLLRDNGIQTDLDVSVGVLKYQGRPLGRVE